MSGIRDKVVAITGASSGIGEATALQLAESRAKLVLCARREDRLQSVSDRIAAVGGESVFVSADVSKRQDMARVVELALETFGKLDVFVSNAGVGPIGPLDELEVGDWEQMIDVNIKGFLYGVAAALPVFRSQEFGHFVTVISTAGLRIVPNQAVYAGTKNAVRTICEGLRQEAGANLRVTSVSPGFVKTNFADSMTNESVKKQTEELAEKIAIPPEAIARAIAFAIEQPKEVDVGDIVVRPTVQA